MTNETSLICGKTGSDDEKSKKSKPVDISEKGYHMQNDKVNDSSFSSAAIRSSWQKM
jgi:hypothetical protein